MYDVKEQFIDKKRNNSQMKSKIEMILRMCSIFIIVKFLILFEKYIPINFWIKLNLISYDKAGELFFERNKTLSFNKLDQIYYGKEQNDTNFNHIHLLFAFDNDYYLLSSITITSILKTANFNSFIHIHILTSKGFEYQTMKKLNSLKEKINNNSEFIFYNDNRTENNFGKIKKESYRIGEYAKLSASEILDESIERVIAFDGDDILVQKDLLELYNIPMKDYLVKGIVDQYARCSEHINFCFDKYKYINGGVAIYNLKKWRELNIYQEILNFYQRFNFKGKILTTHNHILNCILPFGSVGFLPLNNNFNKVIYINKYDMQIGADLYMRKYPYFLIKKKEVLEEENNVVIRHYKGDLTLKIQWQNYGKMTGFYDEICLKYPEGC